MNAALRYGPNELLQQLRKRLRSRIFLRHHLDVDIAPYAFHLLGFISDGKTLSLRYAAEESDLNYWKGLHYLVSESMTFDGSASSKQMEAWYRTEAGQDPPITSEEIPNAEKFLNVIFGFTNEPEPGRLYGKTRKEGSCTPIEWSWITEIIHLIALRIKVEKAFIDSPRRQKKPHTRNLAEVEWCLAPLLSFGFPTGFILADGSIDSEEGQKPLTHYLVDLASAELEEYRWENIQRDTIANMARGNSLKEALRRALADNFSFPSSELWPTHWKRLSVDILPEVSLTFPSQSDNLPHLVQEGLARLRDNVNTLSKQIQDAAASLAQGFRSQSVAAIAAQSLSHNIGSHALSDARLFDAAGIPDGQGLKDLHQYLQGRMDYVAQLIARIPPQPEPLYLWADILTEFFRQRLLLNRLVADRSVEGCNLSFQITFPGSAPVNISWCDILAFLGINKDGKGTTASALPRPKDVLVAIPGGAVGRHALYSILENMMRNTAKYGERRKLGENNLCIHFRLRNPNDEHGDASKEYWLLEVWDNFSGFAQDTDGRERYKKLADTFGDDVINKEGNTRPSGHGLIEIKEAMRFLHDHPDHPDQSGTGSPFACEPHCHRTSPNHAKKFCDVKDCCYGKDHCCHANLANVFEEQYGGSETDGVLVYRVRLQRPHLLSVWAPKVDFREAMTENVVEGVFFRNDLLRKGPSGSPSIMELPPHLLAIRDPQDNATLKEMAETLASRHWQLPYRLFVIVPNKEREHAWNEVLVPWENKVPTEPKLNFCEPFLPRNRVRVLHAPNLHTHLAEPDGHLTLSFVNEVYDHWLMTYKPLPDGKAFCDSSKWHLAVCFDRDIQTVANLWSAANTEKVRALQSVSITAYSQTEIAAGKADWPDSKENARRLIHFGNHGRLPPGDEVWSAIKNKLVAFSQAFGSAEAPRTFNLLYSPPSDPDGFAFFALSLAEAALTEIAIFDERVSGVFLNESASKVFSSPRLREARLARLYPLLAINAFGAQGGAFAIDNVDWKKMEDTFGTIAPKAPTNDFLYPYPQRGDVQMKAVATADILILHEGLIEELVSKNRFRQGSELCYLSRFAQIVRTSGKGRDPRKLDTRLPFCEYSAISAVLAPYKSNDGEQIRFDKIILAKAVMNSFGQLLKKENPR